MLRRLGRYVPIAALLASNPAASAAQASPAQALFGRLMEARLSVLAQEPEVAARANGLRGMALMQIAGDSALYFVDDSGLRQLSALFGESAAQASPEACALLYTAGSDAFPDAFARVLQNADSSLVDRWAAFMVRLVRAGILRPSPGRLASADDVGATIRALIAEQPASDRERLRRGAAKQGDVRDVCFFTMTLYRQLGELPPSKVGPVFRAMMRGVKPKLR